MEKREDELRRLYKLVMQTKWNINICAIARYLYEYAKSRHDDINQKKMLFLLLDTCEKNEVEEWYQVCKQMLSDSEWNHERETILDKVKKKNMKFYLDIRMKSWHYIGATSTICYMFLIQKLSNSCRYVEKGKEVHD